MQNSNKKYKVVFVCLALSVLTLFGTITATNSVSVLVAGDGQETHGGGGKGTKTIQLLIAGDGQETHGGKGTKTFRLA